MRTLVIASIFMVAALAIIGLAVKGHETKTTTSAPATTQAYIAQIDGRNLERQIENQELDCEYKLVGEKLSQTDAHAFCHDSSRNDWEEWAIKYPELAKAHEATR